MDLSNRPAAARLSDHAESANAARLRYVTDDAPGVKRRRNGKGFVSVTTNGKIVRGQHELRRFKALAVPPAWRDVWICALPNGHLQATGRDAKGRKQYRYHPRWREFRDESKYDRMLDFAWVLPTIRRRVEHDLALPGLHRKKILATVIRLLEMSRIRIGNEEYRQQNNSHGLATLRSHHVSVSGSSIRFEFRGKSGVQHALGLNDRRLATIIKRCQEFPGHELFQYIGDNGDRYRINSEDVNDYLRQIGGDEFSSKDFRTWAGTVLAARELEQLDGVGTKTARKKSIQRAIELVAEKLGNTKVICRKCYIHPAVIEACLEGSLSQLLRRRTTKTKTWHGLESEEAAVLALLRRKRSLDKRESESNMRKQLKKSLRARKVQDRSRSNHRE